jgi:predicted glycosyltransferase
LICLAFLCVLVPFCDMRLWLDLANSPHVPFFKALAARFVERGHEIEITAREFAETVPLAKAAGFEAQVVGAHGGRQVSAKAGNLMSRAWALATWARKRQFDLALSHNSYSQILAARGLRIRSVTLMDYEYQPANHLAFRLTSRIIVPESFPAKRLRRYGASVGKVRRYHGTKEDVYLADFQPDPLFATELCELGVRPDNVLVLMRPPAHDALYHRFQNKLFDEVLARLLEQENVQVVLLPRNEAQRASYSSKASERLIVPAKPLDGANLIAASDLVISAGGTINREAAALGVPVASIYAGQWAAVDEGLVREGRLQRISSVADFGKLPIEKKRAFRPRRASAVIDEIVNLIFE